MSYSLALCLQAEPVRFLDHTAISGVYAAIGQGGPAGAEFTNPVRMFGIQNYTDSPLMFSFDGVNDHFPCTGAIMLDVASNSAVSQGYYMQKGQKLYVRNMVAEGYAAPNSGDVWLFVMTGRDTQ
jgi:hypothetical protein